jgi:hypothetical protein
MWHRDLTTHLADAPSDEMPNADGLVVAMNDAGRRYP